MDVEKEASLILGFNKPLDQAEYLQKLHQKKLQEILNVEHPHKGDCFFLPSGLVHSIGKGCFIAEIQQTSDITYRIYDYDRKDINGEPRELHTELATNVIDYNYYPNDNESVQLIDCPYFTTNLLTFDKNIEKEYIRLDSFVIYMCLQGKFTITTGESEPVEVKQEETVLIPASLKNLTLYPDEYTKVLEIYIDD